MDEIKDSVITNALLLPMACEILAKRCHEHGDNVDNFQRMKGSGSISCRCYISKYVPCYRGAYDEAFIDCHKVKPDHWKKYFLSKLEDNAND